MDLEWRWRENDEWVFLASLRTAEFRIGGCEMDFLSFALFLSFFSFFSFTFSPSSSTLLAIYSFVRPFVYPESPILVDPPPYEKEKGISSSCPSYRAS